MQPHLLAGQISLKIGEAHGIPSRRVAALSEVKPALDFAQKTKGPVLLDFWVEKEESVYPMVATGADLDDMIRRPLRQSA